MSKMSATFVGVGMRANGRFYSKNRRSAAAAV